MCPASVPASQRATSDRHQLRGHRLTSPDQANPPGGSRRAGRGSYRGGVKYGEYELKARPYGPGARRCAPRRACGLRPVPARAPPRQQGTGTSGPQHDRADAGGRPEHEGPGPPHPAPDHSPAPQSSPSIGRSRRPMTPGCADAGAAGPRASGLAVPPSREPGQSDALRCAAAGGPCRRSSAGDAGCSRYVPRV
jgi:hypothetical protein